MKRWIHNLALILITMFFCFAAHSEIIQIKGNRVLIKLDGKTVKVGEQLDVVDANGTTKGLVKVTSFNETEAWAIIETGVGSPGMKVRKRPPRKAVNTIVPNAGNSNFHYNFRVNPIGLISGAIAANFDFRITPNITIGPQGAYLRTQLTPSSVYNSNYDIVAYGYGARANWFFSGVFQDGWYASPSLEYLKVSIKTSDAYGPASGSAAGTMASLLFGYGWFWDNFNIMLGGGYASVLGTSSITITDTKGNAETISANLSGLTFEISMGWAF